MVPHVCRVIGSVCCSVAVIVRVQSSAEPREKDGGDMASVICMTG